MKAIIIICVTATGYSIVIISWQIIMSQIRLVKVFTGTIQQIFHQIVSEISRVFWSDLG